MPKIFKVSTAIVTILSLGLLLLVGACKNNALMISKPTQSLRTTLAAIAPNIPPAYYQCTEVLPMDLENAFYSNYGVTASAGTMYGGQVFVFKNLLVDTFMIKDVGKGLLWADLIKCPILNLDYAKTLTPGDRVYIVGYCVGRDLSQSPGLVFKDCFVLQTGSIQLPAPGGGNMFAPAY